MNKLFIGYTRFSLVLQESKAWVISQKESYLKELFNEDRLRNRLFFLKKSLESLALSESSYEKYHFIFYSDILPNSFKKELLEISASFDFAIPILVENKNTFNFLKIISDWISYNTNINQALLGIYNLDDDDFLSNNYFKYSEKYLRERFIGFHVSYGLGIKSYFYDNVFFWSCGKLSS